MLKNERELGIVVVSGRRFVSCFITNSPIWLLNQISLVPVVDVRIVSPNAEVDLFLGIVRPTPSQPVIELTSTEVVHKL